MQNLGSEPSSTTVELLCTKQRCELYKQVRYRTVVAVEEKGHRNTETVSNQPKARTHHGMSDFGHAAHPPHPCNHITIWIKRNAASRQYVRVVGVTYADRKKVGKGKGGAVS